MDTVGGVQPAIGRVETAGSEEIVIKVKPIPLPASQTPPEPPE